MAWWKGRNTHPDMTLKSNRQTPILLEIFKAALSAVDPHDAMFDTIRCEHGYLRAGGNDFDLALFERIAVIGAGKATARMAQALENMDGLDIDGGLVVVKQGHTASLTRIEQVEAAHPLPDAAGVAATQRILQLARDADDRTLLICLFSGGASALLVAPVAGITLADKQQTTRMLLYAGATIAELNAVRKHLSAVKGGRLAHEARPATLLTLVVSDVIGDRLDVIASGPTVADDSTFADAWGVIEKYSLAQDLPSNVRAHLERGLAGRVAETHRRSDPCFARSCNIVIASNRQALAAAEAHAASLGYRAQIVTDALRGEARVMAHELAQHARAELAAMQPGELRCLLYGGETTVTVNGSGLGGRNQELALAFALEIEGVDGITLLSAGTDGTDGPTDAAGAIVDAETAVRARECGLDAQSYLERNDSYHFFRQLDALSGYASHLKTGATGTNVMDVLVILLQSGRAEP